MCFDGLHLPHVIVVCTGPTSAVHNTDLACTNCRKATLFLPVPKVRILLTQPFQIPDFTKEEGGTCFCMRQRLSLCAFTRRHELFSYAMLEGAYCRLPMPRRENPIAFQVIMLDTLPNGMGIGCGDMSNKENPSL